MQAEYSESYARYEARHWWFRARRIILRSVLRTLPLPPRARILEIGTGPGANLYHVYPPDARLFGIEPNPELAALANQRGRIPVHTGSAEELPGALGMFDAVAMFDVLEHTADDGRALENILRCLVPGGLLILTVPAYQLLWGPQDVVSGHYRRYTLRGLRALVRAAGLAPLRATYFNSLLFPAVAVFRLAGRLLRSSRGSSDLRYSLGPVDQLLFLVFAAEKWLLRVFNLPFGVSIFLAARKENVESD